MPRDNTHSMVLIMLASCLCLPEMFCHSNAVLIDCFKHEDYIRAEPMMFFVTHSECRGDQYI